MIVAGAGARGAYEAGALSVLLPALEAHDAAPTLLFGTSAGALNVLGLASLAHEGMTAATASLVELWESVRVREVADVLASTGEDVGRYLLQFVGAGVRLQSLLDTSRLLELLRSRIDWRRLHENVRNGTVGAVAVATTSAATGGTVVFVEKHSSVRMPAPDGTRNIAYVETRLRPEHALASAAIPVAFQPALISGPRPWRGWYLDGGVRMNAPIKPALAFGATRLAVVATHPATYPQPVMPQHRAAPAAPDIVRSAALVLHGALADRMVEDLATLAMVNGLVGDQPRGGYRSVPFVFAGPAASQAHEIGALAAQEFQRLVAGTGAVTNPDLWLLSRLIGGVQPDHGELLSYLYFDPSFTAPAAALGAEHARRRRALVHWRSAL